MRKTFSAFTCLLIISALIVPALADAAIDSWIDKYNESAASASAPKIEKGSQTAASEDEYIFTLSDDLTLGVSLNARGEAYLLTAMCTSVDADIETVTAAALAASDDAISPEQAIEILSGFDVTKAKADKSAYIMAEKNGWVFWLMNTSTADKFQFSISALNGDGLADGEDKPISGFWDGLWEDDGEGATPDEAPAKSAPPDKKIHKI